MVYSTAKVFQIEYNYKRHGLKLICFVQIVPKRENKISLEVKSY